MSDKSFGDTNLLGELLLCLPVELANELGLHLALHFTQEKIIILKH